VPFFTICSGTSFNESREALKETERTFNWGKNILLVRHQVLHIGFTFYPFLKNKICIGVLEIDLLYIAVFQKPVYLEVQVMQSKTISELEEKSAFSTRVSFTK
jgi:hypothetical protein